MWSKPASWTWIAAETRHRDLGGRDLGLAVTDWGASLTSITVTAREFKKEKNLQHFLWQSYTLV